MTLASYTLASLIVTALAIIAALAVWIGLKVAQGKRVMEREWDGEE